MRINPQPTNQELANLKTQYPFNNCNQGEASPGFNEHYFNLLASYAGTLLKGRLLHFGSVCEDFKKFALNKGLRVTEITTTDAIEKLIVDKESFDYVVFVNILQKIRNPRNFLRRIYALLKQDGV